MAYEKERDFLKEYVRDRVDFSSTDQVLGIEMPPLEKEVPEGVEVIKLPDPSKDLEKKNSLFDLVNSRASRRKFTGEKITLEELSYLLFVTYGVRDKRIPFRVLKTAPSAGNRHSIEITLIVLDVEDLKPGIYRYTPMDHSIYKISSAENLIEKLNKGVRKQRFVINSAVVFLLSMGKWVMT